MVSSKSRDSSKSLTKKKFNKNIKKNVRRTHNKRRRTTSKRIKSRSHQRGGSRKGSIEVRLKGVLDQMAEKQDAFEQNLHDINLVILILENGGDSIILKDIAPEVIQLLQLNNWKLRESGDRILYAPQDKNSFVPSITFLREYLARYKQRELEKDQEAILSELRESALSLYAMLDGNPFAESSSGEVARPSQSRKAVAPAAGVVSFARPAPASVAAGGGAGGVALPDDYIYPDFSKISANFPIHVLIKGKKKWREANILYIDDRKAGVVYSIKGKEMIMGYTDAESKIVPVGYITLIIGRRRYWVPAKIGSEVIYQNSRYTIQSMDPSGIILNAISQSGQKWVRPNDFRNIFDVRSRSNEGSRRLNTDNVRLGDGVVEQITQGQIIYITGDLTGTQYQILDFDELRGLFKLRKNTKSRHAKIFDRRAIECLQVPPDFEDLQGIMEIKGRMSPQKVNYGIKRNPNGGMILEIRKGASRHSDKYNLKGFSKEGSLYQFVSSVDGKNQTFTVRKFFDADGNELTGEALDQLVDILTQLNDSIQANLFV